ncbi:hypothetical protein MPLSOD_170034 [Mesorhizobium sp. SOD10]|nr:hypothetical protein MPLSOD_170034 [Mesorhizobium sp. SOD10]
MGAFPYLLPGAQFSESLHIVYGMSTLDMQYLFALVEPSAERSGSRCPRFDERLQQFRKSILEGLETPCPLSE